MNRHQKSTLGAVLSVSEPRFPNRNRSVAVRINNREGTYKREGHFFSFVVLLFFLSGIP